MHWSACCHIYNKLQRGSYISSLIYKFNHKLCVRQAITIIDIKATVWNLIMVELSALWDKRDNSWLSYPIVDSYPDIDAPSDWRKVLSTFSTCEYISGFINFNLCPRTVTRPLSASVADITFPVLGSPWNKYQPLSDNNALTTLKPIQLWQDERGSSQRKTNSGEDYLKVIVI